MSTPMEIGEGNPREVEAKVEAEDGGAIQTVAEQNGGVEEAQAEPSSAMTEDKIAVAVEVYLKPPSTAAIDDVDDQDVLLFWKVNPAVHVFQLSEEGPCEELNADGQPSSFSNGFSLLKILMACGFIYDAGLKQRLLPYEASALLFTEKGVDPFLVSWNRIILLHGPPGTGKLHYAKHWIRNYPYASV